jgi:HEAT repeat protein
MAGHRGDAERAALLAGHGDPAVRAAALGALARMGALGADDLVAAFSDPDATVRRRACGLAGRGLGAGEPATPALVGALVTTVSSDAEPWVVEAAAWALGEAGAACGAPVVRALEQVARGHGDPLCREAAVAALGAIGNPDALDCVLAALGDKPAVRRRAAIALAAFDDPRADEGLRSCLEDRDWQVRQAAEELLGRP